MRFSTALLAAAVDYRLLLDRGYPGKASLALVGDRHRLDAEERLILFRGVHDRASSARRQSLLSRPGPGAFLLLDLYNVAFTIVHRLVGKPCFLSTDGLLRDAGANYGRVPREAELDRAFRLIADALARLEPACVECYLDAPVSRSADHAEAFRARLAFVRMAGQDGAMEWPVAVVHSADGAILARLAEAADRGAPVYVASSDSVLADRSPRVFDLALEVIREAFPEADPIPEDFLHFY